MINLVIHVISVLVTISIIISNEDQIKAQFIKEMKIEKNKGSKRNGDWKTLRIQRNLEK